MDAAIRTVAAVTLLTAASFVAPEPASAQIPVVSPVSQPVVGYVPTRGGLLGLRTVYRPVVAPPAPVVAARPAFVASPAVSYSVAPAPVVSARPVLTAPTTVVTQPTIVSRPIMPAPAVVARPVAPVVTYMLPVVD